MALGKTRRFRTREFAIALVVMAGFAATCGPASGQVYWGDRPSGGWGDRRSGDWGWAWAIIFLHAADNSLVWDHRH